MTYGEYGGAEERRSGGAGGGGGGSQLKMLCLYKGFLLIEFLT